MDLNQLFQIAKETVDTGKKYYDKLPDNLKDRLEKDFYSYKDKLLLDVESKHFLIQRVKHTF